MQKYVVIKPYRIFVLACLFGLLAGIASGATTLHLNDNSTVSGEVVNGDNSGIILKLPDGSYSDRIPWSKLSQADLKELDQNPKFAQFVDPYIDPGQEEKPKKADIEIKNFHRLPRPAGHSLIAALFTTPMGMFIVLMIYGANLYAAYEVSLFRGHSVGLVCGVSAALPFIGPIIFLSMQPQLKQKTPDWQVAEHQMDASISAVAAADHAAPAEIGAAEVAAQANAAQVAQAAAPPQPAAPAHPPAKVYARGQYTFNRRFFETQMPAFFAMTRPEAEKDKVLQVKSSRGSHIAQRICRISQTELCLQVEKGPASEEVAVPFVEIQEVQVKHKDA